MVRSRRACSQPPFTHAGTICDQRANCPTALTDGLPPCQQTAALGELCAAAYANSTLFFAQCQPAAGDDAVACVKVSDMTAVCQLAADLGASDVGVVQCNATVEAGDAAPPAAAQPDSGPIGTCCKPGSSVAEAAGRTWCCPWQVDVQGRCCGVVDSCGVCGGAGVGRDADGASTQEGGKKWRSACLAPRAALGSCLVAAEQARARRSERCCFLLAIGGTHPLLCSRWLEIVS
jgi:hypothetical protein